jgi:hypothetical protein
LRFTILLALFLSGSFAAAQSSLWKSVKYDPPKLIQATISESQHKAIISLLRGQGPSGLWGCEGDHLEEMLKGLTFETIPLSPGAKVLLVEAGAGCARGGQGANGAMWLIRYQGGRPVLLASPQGEFGGWLYSIQPTTSHGFQDIVLGWHMSALETDVTYFRFDGKSYHSIGKTTFTATEN